MITDADLRDPMLKGIITTSELYGGMLAAPVDASGKRVPMPDASRHPTGGVCRKCRQPLRRTYLAFCGGWTALRDCDECAESARIVVQRPARKAEARERTEQSHPWEDAA